MGEEMVKHLHPATKELPPKPYSGAFSVMSILAICFLTVNTAISAVRSLDDPWTFAFVVSVYVLLMLLFLFLHLYDRAPENSDRREKLKIPIWAVASALNIVFAYRVATIMNVAMKCIVWGMAAFSTVSGFYFFFIFPKNSNNLYGACKSCDGQSVLDEKSRMTFPCGGLPVDDNSLV